MVVKRTECVHKRYKAVAVAGPGRPEAEAEGDGLPITAARRPGAAGPCAHALARARLGPTSRLRAGLCCSAAATSRKEAAHWYRPEKSMLSWRMLRWRAVPRSRRVCCVVSASQNLKRDRPVSWLAAESAAKLSAAIAAGTASWRRLVSQGPGGSCGCCAPGGVAKGSQHRVCRLERPAMSTTLQQVFVGYCAWFAL